MGQSSCLLKFSSGVNSLIFKISSLSRSFIFNSMTLALSIVSSLLLWLYPGKKCVPTEEVEERNFFSFSHVLSLLVLFTLSLFSALLLLVSSISVFLLFYLQSMLFGSLEYQNVFFRLTFSFIMVYKVHLMHISVMIASGNKSKHNKLLLGQ